MTAVRVPAALSDLSGPLDHVAVEDKGGAVYNAKAYGAVGDVRYLADANMSSGVATLTSSSGAFTSADVGKAIAVKGAGAAGVALTTTITNLNSSTQVTLGAAASTTVTNARATIGTDNTDALADLINDLGDTAPYGRVTLPPGIYALTAALPIRAYVSVEGMGVGNGLTVTLVQLTDDADGFSNQTGGRVFNADFRGLRLERAPGTTGGAGFNMADVDRSHVYCCNVTENNKDSALFARGYYVRSGIYGAGAYHNNFIDCRARVTTYAWELNGADPYESANSTHIYGGEARADGGTGVYVDNGGNAITIYGLAVEGTTSVGVHFVGKSGLVTQGLVMGCRFEMTGGQTGVILGQYVTGTTVLGNLYTSGITTKVSDSGEFNLCEYTGSLWDLRISRGDMRLKNGKFQTQGTGGEAYWAVTALGDANPVWGAKTSGRLVWGAGGNSATDVTLYRAASAALSLETGRWADAARTFADGDTTPSVGLGNVYATANTGATSITSFDDGATGQRLVVRVDANTTVRNTSGIKLAGGADVTGAANFAIAFQNISGVWYEVGRTTSTVATGQAIGSAGNDAILFTDGSGLLNSEAAEFGYSITTHRFVMRGGGKIGTTTITGQTVVLDGTNTTISSASTVLYLDADVTQSGAGAVIGSRVAARQNYAGTTASASAYQALVRVINTGGTITAGYGFEVSSPVIASGGAITTAYGLYVRQQKITGVTTGYGVYQLDTGDKNYFAGPVGLGATSPNAAAQLQGDSTTQGWLPPRMTSTQRDNISSPPEGLMIYNTTTHSLNVYNGTSWLAVTAA